MDCLDMLRFQGADASLVSLVERTSNLGNIATLNFEELSLEEITSVSSILKFCEETFLSKNIESIEDNSQKLEGLVEKMEELFRQKKLLLDRNETLLKSA